MYFLDRKSQREYVCDEAFSGKKGRMKMDNNLDWGKLGFAYRKTNERYVSNFKDGKWDDGVMTTDDTVTISECAGVLQYCQACFEGLKAYRTEDGRIVTFRPDLNAK